MVDLVCTASTSPAAVLIISHSESGLMLNFHRICKKTKQAPSYVFVCPKQVTCFQGNMLWLFFVLLMIGKSYKRFDATCYRQYVYKRGPTSKA